MLEFWGFDFVDPASQGWTGTSMSRNSTTFRNGTHSLDNFGYSGPPQFAANYATLYLGVAVYVPNALANDALLQLRDGASAQITVTMGTDGRLHVRRGGAGGTILAQSSAGVFTFATWHHLQLGATIGASGSVELRLNGSAVASASGVNTQNTGNAYANRPMVGSESLTHAYFDDFWVTDTGFLGDCKVETIRPTGAGNSTEFTPNGAGSNFQCVDDATAPNNDTDYVSSSTVGDLDLYAMSNLASSSGSVKGVKVSHVSRKDDAGTWQEASVIRSGGSDAVGANVSLNDNYTVHSQVHTVNPVDSSPWTISSVNGVEIGIEVVA